MNKGLRWGAFLLVLLTFLTGCTKSGRLDEGKIACVVELETVPEEFDALREETREKLEIEVHLMNDATERTYKVRLNEENGFRQEAMLNPGFYQVEWCIASPFYLYLDTEARQSVLEVGGEKSNYLGIAVTNRAELAENLRWMEPSEEILAQDKFSRVVQWKGQLIDLKDIMEYVEFTYDQPVRPYQQALLANLEDRVGVTVINETDHELSWRECAVKSVTFNITNAVLPGGVMVGMPLAEVLHSEHGCYGTPDSLTGSILYGAGLEELGAVYLDSASGDKITVQSDVSGKYVIKITYEFEVYE